MYVIFFLSFMAHGTFPFYIRAKSCNDFDIISRTEQ